MTPDYALGVFIPRTMNRIATNAATAVLLGLLPVCVAVWKGWI